MKIIMIETHLVNNKQYVTNDKFDVIFADYIYEDLDFTWAERYWRNLSPNGVFIAMTDFHSSHYFRVYMEEHLKGFFVNHLVWKNEWGNHPKKRFHQCYDDILIYSNGVDWNFFSDKIQVEKKTKAKELNPSGRLTKTATAWIDDITLITISKERVKKKDGHLVRWQKPLKLYDRIIAPFITDKSNILDLFMGSGSLGLWCKKNNINYLGLENDAEIYELALANINGENNDIR